MNESHEDYRDKQLYENLPRHCGVCGRFLKKNDDGSYRCVKVTWDDWNGGWEHS